MKFPVAETTAPDIVDGMSGGGICSATEAGRSLGISGRQVRNLIRTGILPATRVGGAFVIQRVELEKVRLDRKPGPKSELAVTARQSRPKQGLTLLKPLLTATKLVQWADERRSQETLPLLIRRLILATVDPQAIDFPWGDSVSRAGYDGMLRVAEAAFPLPCGKSVWEMGANRNVQQKANNDYDIRSAEPKPINPAETTFVFVTPRRFQKKAEWALDRRAERRWGDVRVIDADDLEQWLDRCPAVATWAAKEIANTPVAGLRDFQEVWGDWETRTTPRLVPEVLLAGRLNEANAVRRWISGPPACFRIQADTTDEAMAFFAAVAQLFEDMAREQLLARGIFVTNAETWRAVAS